LKIKEFTNTTPGYRAVQPKEDINTGASRKSGFQEQFEKFERETGRKRLESLVEDITAQGLKLSKRIDISELRIYRMLIAEFIETALSHSMKFSKQNFLDKRGRHKIYSIIEKVNEEVEELTREVLENEGKNISLLKRLGEIRGLLLDMIL